MNFMELTTARYSCRKFTSQPVPEEKLNRILSAGLNAPTAVNKQPFHIWVMKSEQAKEAVRSVTACHFGAETFLVVGGKPEDGWIRTFDGYHFADVDAAIAATHMMLAVTAQGLATTWVGCFDAPKLISLCPQMEGYNLIAIFPIGYPDEGPSPRHGERKNKSEIVSEI